MSRHRIASLLFALLAFATLTISLDGRWPRAVFECGAFALAAVVLARWREQPRPAVPWETLLLLVPAAIAGLQMAAGSTAAPWLTLEAASGWAALAAVVFVARYALNEVPVRHRFLTACALAGAVVAGSCLLQVPLRGTAVGWWRIPDFDVMAGPFQNRNTYGSFAELLLPVLVWKAVNAKRGAWAWWGATALVPASVVVTGTRAGSMLVMVELGILLLVQIRARILFPLTGIALVVMASGWDTLADRVTQEDWSAHRRQMYQSAWEMFREHPLAGQGVGTFIEAYPRFAHFDVGRRVNHAHNDWLEWAAEGGLPMILALAGLLGWVAARARRHMWSWGVAFVMAHSLVDYPLQRPGLSAWVWVICGLVLAAVTNERGNRRTHSRKRRRSRSGEEEAAAVTPPAAEAAPAGSAQAPLVSSGQS